MIYVQESFWFAPARSVEALAFVARINAVLGKDAVDQINAASESGIDVQYTTEDLYATEASKSRGAMGVTTGPLGNIILRINGGLYMEVEKLIAEGNASVEYTQQRAAATVAHELVHVEQVRSGRLSNNKDNQTVWEGTVWTSDMWTATGYINLPWEVEAHNAGVKYMRKYGFKAWFSAWLELYARRLKEKPSK